jgi:hypothetical protein
VAVGIGVGLAIGTLGAMFDWPAVVRGGITGVVVVGILVAINRRSRRQTG